VIVSTDAVEDAHTRVPGAGPPHVSNIIDQYWGLKDFRYAPATTHPAVFHSAQ